MRSVSRLIKLTILRDELGGPRPLLNLCSSLCISLCLVIIGAHSPHANASPQAFWSAWSDGAAEVNTYQLTQPRYGELRSGTLQLIYVTEPFSKSRHVKVDRYDAANPDHTIALKLNIVESWRTGVYEYRVMTSHFFDAQSDLAPLKVAFSSQEWCGVIYEEIIWDQGEGQQAVQSYFEGESTRGPIPQGTRPIDQIFTLGRGLLVGGPAGVKSFPKRWIASAKTRRLSHQRLSPFEGSIEPQPAVSLETELGTLRAYPLRYHKAQGQACTLYIEEPAPHRVLSWRCDDGERAELLQSQRSPYWVHTRERDAPRAP